MFCYCPKCANIKNIKNFQSGQKCEICGNEVLPVPQEYLMSGGSFFKSQDDRNRLIEKIRTGTDFDTDLFVNKESIRKEKDNIAKEAIEKKNSEMKENGFKLTCPICGSHDVSKISAVGKYAKVYAFGLLGADSLGKKWKCNICGAKF